MLKFLTRINIVSSLVLSLVNCSYQFDDTGPVPAENCIVVHTSDNLSSAALSIISLDTLQSVNNVSAGEVHTDASVYRF
jgi:hypothetical protein